ncbi:type II secretion system F family protein [Brevibacillus laterosporus]|uniref:type II secretion system F family protein n=1 Tax=Brevibacillus laterosporus TaxID=1465 RepID=UPI001EF199B2|nr:type II secretion system F family protein [Brevibacillus laterosporus]MCG7319062.1 type II secretion system F family protein [Brevibacillus laterosporus]MED1786919.1 type II secretion system F family protein [Brevibacillus laterosporus]
MLVEWTARCVALLSGGLILSIMMPANFLNVKTENSSTHMVITEMHQNRKSWDMRIEERLKQARVDIGIRRYVLLCFITGLFFYVLTLYVLDSWWLALPFWFIGVLVVHRWLAIWRNKKRVRFEEENQKALRIIASSIRANPSYIHAFEQVATSRFIDKSIAQEYGKIVEKLRGTLLLEDAMNWLYVKTGSSDIQYVATIIQVQRELGGDMAQTLDIAVSSLIRRKQAKRRQVSALSQILSQVNLLSAMPFFFVGILYVNNPNHFAPLTESLSGRFAMLGSFLLIIAGGEVIRYLALSVGSQEG